MTVGTVDQVGVTVDERSAWLTIRCDDIPAPAEDVLSVFADAIWEWGAKATASALMGQRGKRGLRAVTVPVPRSELHDLACALTETGHQRAAQVAEAAAPITHDTEVLPDGR